MRYTAEQIREAIENELCKSLVGKRIAQIGDSEIGFSWRDGEVCIEDEDLEAEAEGREPQPKTLRFRVRVLQIE